MKKATFSVPSFTRKHSYISRFPLSISDFFSNIISGLTLARSTFNFHLIATLFILLVSAASSYAQVTVPFVPRLTGGNVKVKGDVVLIGNSIITGRGLASPYNGTGSNNSQFGEYIDVDTDPTTFSSSTAQLAINNSCKRIVFAGLYWASIYPNEEGTNASANFTGTPRLDDWNQVKFSLPNGTALNLTANKADPREVIFDGYNYSNINLSFKDSPIICFKDITTDLAGLTNADGTYTLANLRATKGRRNGGCAAGWTLVVIYESPTLPSKFISVFDGYAGVQGTTQLNIPVSGFRTLPSPLPVNAKIGVSALEGDLGITGDTFQFKAASRTVFTAISDAVSPANNFFNSSNSNNGVRVTSGNPSSSNLLGYDIKNVIIANALKNILPNNETAGELRLTTNNDGYGAFVTTFAVDIIEPAILLTKEVKDNSGADASGANVTLGQQLNYVIGFENQGNDDATEFTIKDILPNNITFNYPADLGTLPPGVTHTYNAATRTIIFNIPNNLVTKNLTPGPPFIRYEIRLKVTVVPTCNDLSDACDNRIQNSAYATYRGLVNATQITDDPSLSSFTACNLGTPQATNFLVGVSDCLFTKNEILCGASKAITASNGYASYDWTGPFGFTGTGQTVTVTQPGVYKVFGVGNRPCTDYNEEITVAPFGGTTVNPINAFADNKQPDGSIAVCPNNGKELPKIFLCGLSASRAINTGITGANSIVWETTNCVAPAGLSDLCANESVSCTWTNAGPNGPNFVANTAGQFRLTINYDGGCFNQYYFNVYKNVLDPRATATDIICTTPGSIVVSNVPSSGYEFSIDGINYQTSNTFIVNTQNTYTVYVRQQNIATNPCVFTVLNVGVRRRNFTVTTNATQPLCFGDRGNIVVVANDVNPQYTFNIYPAGGTTAINTSGLQTFNQFTFGNLAGGSYDVEAITQDGCIERQRITINTVTALTASAAITKPITCTDGQITVTPQGGTAPYNYSINNAPFVTDNVFNIPSPGGTFSFIVVDSNNCSVPIAPITMDAIPAPTPNTTSTNVKCYNDLTGTINFNVANANGYTLAYSIDNGATYGASATFSGLAAGTYNTILRYTLNSDICFDTMRPITISQPAAAVTASAGVSELAGCGIAPNTNFGRVRITNPQGGVSPYEYSFDNQFSWTTVNDAYVAPGTYTLFVRDANNCIFSAPVTLDPEPVAPVINVDTPVDFNCDGSATSKVTVNNPGGINYTYVYSRNDIVNTNVPPNEFINVPPGTHKITVAYNLGTVPTFSNLLFENFGYGDDTTSPGINTTFYCFERQVVATQCRNNIQINDGDYSVTARIISPFGPWLQPGDHTPPTVPPTPRGRALVVNIGDQIPVTEILYEKVINNIIPNQPINVEFFAFNLLNRFNNQANPDLRVALMDASGTEISFYNTGEIPKSERWENYPKTPVTLNPGANTTLRFIVRSNVRQTSGNDVAIDDIRVYQLPKTCITTRDFTIFVPTGKAFAAQITGERNVTCAGAVDGQFTINVQNFDAATGFQYSIDNGATFTTSLTSPVIITGRAAGTFAVVVRPDAAAIGACSKPFSVIITEPTAVTADAIIVIEATCTTGATIRATGGGGTPAYQYELRAADGTTVITAFNNNPDFTNVPVGNYTVFVKDGNGCLNPTGVPISVGAAPTLSATLAATTDFCYTPANPATLVVTVTGGTAPFTYRFNSNTPQNSNTFTNVNPGTHTIVVTDSNNCTTTITNIIIAPQLILAATLAQDLTCVADAVINTTVTGGYPVSYTYTVSYNGQAATAITSFPYTATVEGTYVFTVTDGQNCTATSNTVTVTPKTTPIHTTVKTDVTCNGLSNGTITVTATGGFTSAYSYVLTGPTNVTQTTNQFIGLAAGTYNVKVIDSKGCESVPSQVIIENPAAIAANASATAFTCSTTNTKQSATITVAPTGGTGTFIYSYNNGTSFGSASTLTVNDNGNPQEFRIIVKDSNGCLSPVQTIVIAPLNPPTDLTFANAAVTCAATTTTVTVTATNGVGVLQYETIAPSTTIVPKQTSNVFASLTPGVYVFRVTDANGCFYTESHTIAPVTPIVVTATKLSDVACFAGATGSIRYNVSGFSTTYSYVVNTEPAITGQSASTFILAGKPSGTYVVVFTDNSTGCTSTTSVTINQPVAALSATYAPVNANCNVPLARVTVTAAEGTPSYRYSFVTSSTIPGVYGTSNIANLDPVISTTWFAHIIDANNCTFVLPITIAKDPTPTVTASATGQCLGSGTYTITAAGSGGVGTLTYSINGGASYQTSPIFTVTTAGNYTITVKDANGCTAASNVVTVNPQLTLSAVLNKDITCSLPTAAQITVAALGGNGTYNYSSSPATGTFTGNVFTTNTPGNYTFTVTDTSGNLCTASTTTAINVTAPVLPVITGVTQTATIRCNGDDTAAISIAIDNTQGQSPFVFNVLNTTTGVNYGTQTSGLSAGDYTITVTDAKGCTDTFNISIAEPSAVVFTKTITPITCNAITGQSLGRITINSVSGGTPNYIYHVTGVNGYDVKFPNETGLSAVFDVVDFGLYQIIITDANGCTAFENDILIASPPTDLDISVVPVGPTCAGLGSAQVAIGVASSITGAGPFHFAVYSPGLTYTGPTSLPWYDEDAPTSKKATIPNLIPGVTYTFIVHDAGTGCYYFETADIAIPTNSAITVNPITPNNITCRGAADGSVTFTMNHTYGVDTPVTYQIFNALSVTAIGSQVATTIPAAGSLAITNFGVLPFGNYFVLVTETTGALNSGCSVASAPFNITESAIDLSITATKIKNVNCNEDGVIAAQAQDGTAPYTYQYLLDTVPAPIATTVGWISATTFATNVTGNYIVYVKDAFGCIKNANVVLPADLAPTVTAPAVPICYDGNPFTITFSGTVDPAIVGAPTYSINGSAFQNSPSFTFNAAGTYNLVIKDGNGCEANVDYIVLSQLQLTPALTKVLDCNLPAPNATLTVTATGGAGTVSYSYIITSGSVINTTGATSGIFTGLDAGNYTFEVNDGACTATTTFVIDPIPATVIATPVVTNVSCNGGNNGTISINVTSGIGPFEYSLFDGATSTAFQSDNIFTGLVAGTTYVVTVRNDRDCLESTAAIIVTEPTPLTATANVAANTTCSPTTLITVTASGGNPFVTGLGYLYNFNGIGFTTDNTFPVNNNSVAQIIDYIVKDSNGCETALQMVTTPPLSPPSEMDIDGTPVYCLPAASQTSTVTITNVINGVGTFTYQNITSGTSNATGSFSGLAPGDYLFQVTDANGCTYQELFTVNPVNNITAAVNATTDVTCFGFANGTATINVANFGITYTAILTVGTASIGQTGNVVTLTAMQPGSYTLRVTDDITGCFADVPVTITAPTAALASTSTATNTNCDNDNSTITITATGGTTNYQYAVARVGDPTPTVFTANNIFVVDTNGGADMDWRVYVTDANGCSTNNLQNIILDASPSAITVAPYSECPDTVTGTYTFTVNLPTGVAPFTYSIGGGFQTSPIFIVNAPGSYDITVKDGNGCTTTATALVTIRQPLILTPTVTTAPSCTDGDGVIAVATTGGSLNYEYRIDSGLYPMSIPFTGIASGPHIIYVRDTTTGCEASVEITLLAATPITGFALATTPVTCNGGNDGTIRATLATPAPGINNNPIYTYTLTGTTYTNVIVNRGPQPSPLFSGLAAGTYNVVVTSGRGCTAAATIDVTEPTLIVVPAPTVVPFGCTTGNTGNLATITVINVSGGTGPYLNYEFIKIGSPNVRVQFSSSNMYTEANLAGGSYLVNVYDSQGCMGSALAPIIIAPYVALDKVNVAINQAITCTNLESITVTATTIGGAATNLEYTLVDINATTNTTGALYPSQPNTTGIFTGLVVADYLITVRNLDTNCEIQGVHYVNEPNTFDLTIDTVVDVICFGGNDGSANITFVDRLITTTPVNGNDAGPFAYTVRDAAGITVGSGMSPNAGPITITGLAAGTYTVTATLSQSPSCTVSKNFTITGPNVALDITETHTEITCVTGNNDGTISVAAIGGWPGGYEYELLLNGNSIVAYGTQTEFTGLVAGNYTINVRDSKGCVDFVNVTLANPTPIAFTATSSAALNCFGDTTSSITASAPTGGSGSYLYTLITTFATGTVTNNGPQFSNIFTNLGAASYQVKVTDSWGCETTAATIVIAQPALVTASLVLALANTCLDDATLTLTAAGGTAPYSYSVDSNFTTSTAISGSSVTFPVAVGTYNYYVKDANGCTSFISNDIKIDSVPDLTITAIVTNDIICFGDNSGVIVSRAQGGLGNYVYTLLDSNGNPLTFTPTQTTAGTFTNLIAGSYLVNVVSGDCQERTTVALVITEPSTPLIESNVVTNVTCSGEGDGKIVITASGGTGVIKYAISPNLNQFFESNVFDDLRPGFYDYIVQDQNGCFIYTTGVEIIEPNSIFVTTVSGSEMPEVCAGDNDGMFSINITGGNAPYSVSINDRNGTYTDGVLGQTQFDFAGLTGSEHIVYVRDGNDCTTEHTVILGEAVTLNPQRSVAYDCVSNSASNSVTITVDPSNNQADLDYALDGSATFQSSNVFSNLATGLHSVEVRHSNGCIKAIVFEILQVDPLTLILTDGGLNEIVATAAGGIKNYQFSLDGESVGTQSSFIITKSGNYTVTVTDASGCTATATRFFEFIDIKIPNAFTPNGDGNNDTWAPTNTINYKDLTFDVFDRYGRRIGKYTEGQFWDGRYNGAELPSGDYWYVVKIKQSNDGREFVGHFTLYR
jgi:gliding motility-associated-like protein